MCVITGAILHDPQTKPTVFFSPPNGLRYPLVGGTRQRHFVGTNLKPRKVPENAATPTSRVHAVLGSFFVSYHSFILFFNDLSEIMGKINYIIGIAAKQIF